MLTRRITKAAESLARQSKPQSRYRSIARPWIWGMFGGLLALGLFGAFSVNAAPSSGKYLPSTTITPPALVREFRGTWVASVANIDWPSKPGLSVAQQKAELIAILDRAALARLNAVIFQVRPACDALYQSPFEPWSEYLTGQMGKAPEPYYDPLAFAIQEAHGRGLELHAWFNPFRARHFSAKTPAAKNHISRTQPALVKSYGKFLWLDPGEPAARDYSMKVILDVVRRYDVDGIHLDDYFYPYQEKDAQRHDIDFPDSASWAKYQAKRGKLSRADWRRENINVFIEALYTGIKRQKPWVKFGISPFGIWRSGVPAHTKGLDAYENLYADSRKWLANGWLDYLAPQLYWSIDSPDQSYPTLLKWWLEQNAKDRHVWPGLNTAKVGTGWQSMEIVNEIASTRQLAPKGGHIHWSVKPLLRNDGKIVEALLRGPYAQPAVVPPCPWLGKNTLEKPRLYVGGNASTGAVTFTWQINRSSKVSRWVAQTRSASGWTTRILPANLTMQSFGTPLPEAFAISGIDACGNQGPTSVVERR